MKNKDFKNPYATLSVNPVKAPNKQKDESKASKTVSSSDLRMGGKK